MAALRFSKYEGLGNDFIVVDGTDPIVAQVTPAIVRKLCDRHLGIGADGLLKTGTNNGRPYMTVINADGSEPEMCGNGIRCIALHLRRNKIIQTDDLVIDSASGPHRCVIRELSDAAAQVEVFMRVPSLDPSDVPVTAQKRLIDEPVTVGDTTVHLTAVSMGNPHAVTFDPIGSRRLELGPAIEKHSLFPRGTNVGFAVIERSGAMTLDVWERGAGWTLACGTGACAAAVAAVYTGRARRNEPVEVRLPGGSLSITVADEDSPAQMLGPARHVFDGAMSVDS